MAFFYHTWPRLALSSGLILRLTVFALLVIPILLEFKLSAAHPSPPLNLRGNWKKGAHNPQGHKVQVQGRGQAGSLAPGLEGALQELHIERQILRGWMRSYLTLSLSGEKAEVQRGERLPLNDTD